MAAIQSGVIMNAEGGPVLMHLSKGLDEFQGAEVNGVKSHPGGSPLSTIYLKEGPIPTTVGCGDLGQGKLKYGPGLKYGAECPAGC